MSREELKKECAKAFFEGNKQDAERLLPLIRQRDIVRIAVSSRLLHHAAQHGWLDTLLAYSCQMRMPIYRSSRSLYHEYYTATIDLL